jgi:hypothetical protein
MRVKAPFRLVVKRPENGNPKILYCVVFPHNGKREFIGRIYV